MPLPFPGIPDLTNKEDLPEQKTKSIGVIIPPPEIRKIADKTAEYVAKNGSAFEEIVMKSEANNPKFSFLKLGDPYRAYFEEKVIEFAKGAAVPEKEEKEKSEAVTVAPIVQKKDIKKEIRREVKPPPADRFTVRPQTTLTVLDMDVIKHTAQYVARNGQKFLIALTEREKQNPQFDFLKPNHQLFPFFTNLVDAYSKVSNPTKGDITKLQQFANDKMAILNAAGERFEYEMQTTQAKKKKEDLDEEERLQMAQIDWNEFVVVETINLFDNEELPAPSNFNKPEVKPLEAGRTEQPGIPAQYLPGYNQEPQRPVPTTGGAGVEVKKDYVRKAAPSDTPTQKCPLCGQHIPVSEFNEHFRIENLDPRYKEVKAEVQSRAQNITMVSGEDIAKNLQAFARNKPTVFGSMEEQQARDDKNKQAPKLIWDGQSATMTRTTGNQAMIAQQQRRNFDEQKRVIQELDLTGAKPTTQAKPSIQQVIGPTPGKMATPAGPYLPQEMPPRAVHEKPDIGVIEGTKKVRSEESNLIPEATWLLMNPESITVNIAVPNIEEENIQSKILSLKFDPKTTIGEIKEQLSSTLNGIPAAKMRLNTPQISPLNDYCSLAYYNVLNGTVLNLGLKERGGRNR